MSNAELAFRLRRLGRRAPQWLAVVADRLEGKQADPAPIPVRDQLAITMTLDLGALGEQDVTFAVIYSPATPDVRYLSNGDPGYPGDPAELEVISAKVGDVDIASLLPEDDDLYDRLCECVEEEDRDR